jgi:hypothetical protein
MSTTITDDIPAMAALRTNFDTYLCFDQRRRAIIHRPPSRLKPNLPLLCTTGLDQPKLQLIFADGRLAPLARHFQPPVIHLLPKGKLLLGELGQFLSARVDGETDFHRSKAGPSEAFVPEAAAHALASPQRRRLDSFRTAIFTAAGDRNNIAHWLDGPRDFALIVAYYGDDDAVFARLRAVADIAIRARGGKFQILKSLFRRQPGLLQNFDHILVSDDDLIWPAAQISRAFALAAQFDLWLCQPAFDAAGRLSYPTTACLPGQQTLRFTNFVEMTCPIFRADKLRDFLNVFDGSLSGYGVDFWFCDFLGRGGNLKFAIFDAVTTINPHESTKPSGHREIENLRPLDARLEEWNEAARTYNLRRIHPRILGSVTLDNIEMTGAMED